MRKTTKPSLLLLAALAGCPKGDGCGGDNDPLDSVSATAGETTDASASATTTEGGSSGGGTDDGSTGSPTSSPSTTETPTTTATSTDGTATSGSTGTQPFCGDGNVDEGEECDEGANNSDAGACTSQCKVAFCGDGLVGPNEACDNGLNQDGQPFDSYTCDADCTPNECGDGHPNLCTEGCDNGGNDNSGGCVDQGAKCYLETCGDGNPQPGEQCDDMGDSPTCMDNCVLKDQPKCNGMGVVPIDPPPLN